MAILLPDARHLSDEILEALRLRAVHGCELGFSETDVADLLGVARETVCHWWTAYRSAGVEALPQDRSGRPLGSGRSLDDAQGQHLQELIDQHSPEALGIAAPLWSRRAVAALIEQQFGLNMPVRTVGEYLKRWGYTPKKPRRHARRQDPVEVRDWLAHTYPDLQRRAVRENAEIHWCDETGVGANDPPGRGYARQGQPSSVDVSGARFRVNLVSTITNQGKVRFMTYAQTLTAVVFIQFLTRLVRGTRRKIFLLLDRHPVHESAAVADWVAANAAWLEVFWLPRRAPELNPAEYLNNEVHGQVNAERLPDTAAELESNFQRFMNKLKHLPGHVMSYFCHPSVQYAAANNT